MKILMLLYTKFPPDIRVEKEAKALLNAGHEVFVVAKGKQENVSDYSGIKILTLKNYKLDYLIFMMNFFRPILLWKLKKSIKKYKIDAVHVHDLPLLKTGYKAAKKFKIPVIADLHENYPAALICYNSNSKGLKKFVRNRLFAYKRYRRYERKYLKKVSAVIFVVPEAVERLKKYLHPNKCFIVSNTVDMSNFNKLKIDNQIVDKYKDKFVVSYVGGFGIHRGIDTSIKAMRYVSDDSIRLLLIGVIGKGAEKLKMLAKKINVENKVEFIDWIPFEQVNTYIRLSDICLVPHNDFEHTQTTVPHKLFQYMYLKKAVLVSNCAPLKRIVEQTNSGLVFFANDAKDMGDKIMFLKNHPDKLTEFGVNGHNWTLKKYNWEIESKKLIKLYESLQE